MSSMSTPAVEHTEHKDYIGDKVAMWLFLFTELLLFGGMFLAYAVYRATHPQDFHHAAMELDVYIGTLNTLALLTSSLTVAISISAIQKGNKSLSLWMLGISIGLGLVFMINKYFEWGAKFHHGLYPGSELLAAMPKGEQLFFGLYFTMTGLHGLHVLIGMVLLFYVAIMISKNRVTADDYVLLENSGLYWHLVDLIWIYLFPLFYLIT